MLNQICKLKIHALITEFILGTVSSTKLIKYYSYHASFIIHAYLIWIIQYRELHGLEVFFFFFFYTIKSIIVVYFIKSRIKPFTYVAKHPGTKSPQVIYIHDILYKL